MTSQDAPPRVSNVPESDATPAAPPPPPQEKQPKAPGRVRSRFRRRMQRLAQSRFALFFMCLLSFADACCSPILPEVLYVPMILLRPQRRWFYAFWCSASSVLGGIAGYWLGFWLWEHGLREFAFEHLGFDRWYDDVSDRYGENAFLAVWMGGFTPLPYKIFTVMAGVCHDKVDFWIFLLASFTSRFPRIYLTVLLLDRYGQAALDMVSRQFSRFVLVLLVLALAIVAYVQFF